jgi:hypothetical protein
MKKMRGLITLCFSLVVSVAGAAPTATRITSLDGDAWCLAPDPKNVGVAEKWWEGPRPEAKPAKVPWTIQGIFPGYGGVAWYWREVEIPANPHVGGRYLLRFWDVDYLADVWVNGTHVGRHEGAQARFTFDVTAAVKPGQGNRIAVRVLSPWDREIDGFIRGQTPHGGYRGFNFGGILDSVELIAAPQVRMDDLFVRADPATGKVRLEAGLRNESKEAAQGSIEFTVASAASGEPVSTVHLEQNIAPGTSTLCTELPVANPRPWQLEEPFLYRATGRLKIAGSASTDETATRFGFRDFRFEKGCFRLNGRRVFWRFAHTGADTPATVRVPYDPGLLRRDLLNLKAMGFNTVRFISIMGQRFQLELCDEIGLMVYQESHASWMLDDSPKLAERMDNSFAGMVLRDRNHPSVVAWGLLNETGEGSVFRHAVASLPLFRRLDDSRLVMLGSGRFDSPGNAMNGLEVWKPETGAAPCLTHNPKPYGICCVTLWRPGEVALIPGTKGEYGAVRWTAPADGDYRVSARFRGAGTYTGTEVRVLAAGKPVYGSFINLNGHDDQCAYAGTVHTAKGQTLDFIVGGRTRAGGAWYEHWAHNTTLSATIASSNGTTNNLETDFSNSRNPNGAWSYGWLAAGAAPDPSTFKPFTRCQAEKGEVVGGLSNPGSDQWEDVLADLHFYPRVPHRELEIGRLRTIAGNDHPLLLSEYGVGSGVDLPRMLRHYEQIGMDSSDGAHDIKVRLTAFNADWERLKLADTFASPEDFFGQCVARMAGLRKMGINAIRSNPHIVGYGLTSCVDPLTYGEGLTTAFRELKPGTMDAMFDAFYPVRWCTFVEPVHVYRGSKVHLEAVLSNEDAAPPGQYPARLQIVGPDNRQVWNRRTSVTVPTRQPGQEPPYATPMFSENLPVDGPSGKYRFLVAFEKGVAASGGEAEFYVTDPADMPSVDAAVVTWGDDPELTQWLKEHAVKVRPYAPGLAKTREVILVSYAAGGDGNAEAWRDLARRIAQGSTAVFLTLDVFKKAGHPLGWLPLANKGTLGMVSEYTFPQVYPKDEWVKRHPLFEGLPCGGLMDYTFYREIVPDLRYWGQAIPDEPVAGAFRTSCPGHHSELMLSVYHLGAGRFILNSLRVRQALGQDPTAERLLRNMLRYAATDLGKPLPPLPAAFDAQLKAIGY